MLGLLESCGINVTAIPAANSYAGFLVVARRILAMISTDVLYALKPYPTSFGIGLYHHLRSGVPLALDIDDWELGGYQGMGSAEFSKTVLLSITSPNNYVWLRALYGRTSWANAITVSSNYLQRKFGGVIVPHGRDPDFLDPAKIVGQNVREKFGLEDTIVMFVGTVRRHKGIEDLIEAVKRIDRSNVICAIVGANLEDSYVRALESVAGGKARFFPMIRFEQLPEWLAASDIVAIPQRATAFTDAQVPAKLFDAMAMARPIISTDVSDIPEILRGCGVIVPPGNVTLLAEAIIGLVDDPDRAKRLGSSARKKFKEEYSLEVVQRRLGPVIEGLIAGRNNAKHLMKGNIPC
jgi:glycosyltransferase involved in cell wall biosynthesis